MDSVVIRSVNAALIDFYKNKTPWSKPKGFIKPTQLIKLKL